MNTSWMSDWLRGVSEKLAANLLMALIIFVGAAVMAWAKTREWRWATPLFYGLVTGVCLYVVLLGIPTQRPEHPQRPGFAEAQIYNLKGSFLALPRPCSLKITAPPENMDYRCDFIMLATDARVPYLSRRQQMVIEPCKVIEDEKDRNPEAYADQLGYAPRGIIIVNTAPTNAETAEFIVSELRSATELKVRPGDTLPPNSPENLIYIQIGTGTLRG